MGSTPTLPSTTLPDREATIQLALNAIENGILSHRAASKAFDIPRSTLQARRRGGSNAVQGHAGQQRLTPAEEDAIATAALQLNLWGWPLTIDALETLATRSLKAKGDINKLGDRWYRQFLSPSRNQAQQKGPSA